MISNASKEIEVTTVTSFFLLGGFYICAKGENYETAH